MSVNRVTLKNIAQRIGVSTTTVHRALNGKAGVGESMDKKIKKIAAEMGYRSNYFAATLKGKIFRIAIAFPEPVLNNKFYYMNLWMGVRKFLGMIPEFDLESIEFQYPYTVGSNGTMLKEIYEKYADDIDGLLTIAVDNSQSSYFLEKFNDKGIAIALVGSDLYKDYRLCCVKTYDEMVGRMGAEMLTTFSDNNEIKLIITGNPTGSLGMIDQFRNANGFYDYISSANKKISVINAFEKQTAEVSHMIKSIISETPDIYGMYSCSARHTVEMCRAVEDLGLSGRIKLIGNDCFPESVEYLKNGVLAATIDKKISDQSFLAMQALFNFIVKGEYPPQSLIYVRPTVVMRSNIDLEVNS